MNKHVGRTVVGIIDPGILGVKCSTLEVIGSVPVTSSGISGMEESLLLLRHDNGAGKWCYAAATVKDSILDENDDGPCIGMILPLDVSMKNTPPKEISARLRALADVVDKLNEV